MINNDHKLIIICGMPHSGTTILTYILRQNPDFMLFTNGTEINLLENDLLPLAKTEEIEKIDKTKKRIILKRPWVECGQVDWLIENMPNAYYIYCFREKENIIETWSSNKCVIGLEFIRSSYEYKIKQYEKCYENAAKLKKNVKNFMVVNYSELTSNSKKIFYNINEFLNCLKFDYDLSCIFSGNSIKKIIQEEQQIIRKNIENFYNYLVSLPFETAIKLIEDNNKNNS